jgi:ADP-heptose:LPS heptosyltransferase
MHAYARAMRALDLLITIDSMPAHLAGALGVQAWVMLHDDPDWRWMVDRDDSPWYPTVRLFRQRTAGDWVDVAARVNAALGEWMASDAILRRCRTG